MKPRAFKRIWGHSWDWGYLIKLEYYKLKEMADGFERRKFVEGWEDIVKEIRLCLRLIKVISEEDRAYDINTGKLNKYVNVKNCSRFLNKWEISVLKKRPDNHILLDNLRIKKAFYLYNKIRTYKMMSWWD